MFIINYYIILINIQHYFNKFIIVNLYIFIYKN